MKSVLCCCCCCLRGAHLRSSKLFGRDSQVTDIWCIYVYIDHCSAIVNVDQQIAFTYRLAHSFLRTHRIKQQKRYGQHIHKVHVNDVCQSYFFTSSFDSLVVQFFFISLLSHKIPLCVHVNYEEFFFFLRCSRCNVCSIIFFWRTHTYNFSLKQNIRSFHFTEIKNRCVCRNFGQIRFIRFTMIRICVPGFMAWARKNKRLLYGTLCVSILLYLLSTDHCACTAHCAPNHTSRLISRENYIGERAHSAHAHF